MQTFQVLEARVTDPVILQTLTILLPRVGSPTAINRLNTLDLSKILNPAATHGLGMIVMIIRPSPRLLKGQTCWNECQPGLPLLVAGVQALLVELPGVEEAVGVLNLLNSAFQTPATNL